ncbi:MAG: asparagine synthetase B [Methanobrevibacter sp.]|jgi:asparagine synthase (glutamine-hydrolysing)|nr:asparagine synthetase B [Methanobrevibacter sp.]
MKNEKYFLNHHIKHGLKLSFHGEIYNHKQINDFLSEYSNLDYLYGNDLFLELIYYLITNNCDDYNNINKYLNENQKYKAIFNNKKTIKKEFNLLVSTLQALMILNGDFVFSISDGENLSISRDVIGSYLLYYGYNNKTEQSQPLFSDNRKDLWAEGIENVKTLKPGHILFNNELYPPINPPWNKHKIINSNIYKNDQCLFKDENHYNRSKNELIKLLKLSVKRRVDDLDEVGLFFSGGVDSTIIAKILKDISKTKDLNIKLLTVGTENAKDIKISKKIAKDLELDLNYSLVNESIIYSEFEKLLNAIEKASIIDLGVGMTIYLASELATEEGIKTILTGQGADELFGGYNRYLESYTISEDFLENELSHDIEFMHEVNFQRDIAIAKINNLNFRSPFLDKDFIKYALNLPSRYKIKSNDDKLRKHILRDMAIDLEIPQYIANRPKKAAQYGSGIHKIITKKILSNFDYKQYLKDLKMISF